MRVCITFKNSPSPHEFRWGDVNTEKVLYCFYKVILKSTCKSKAAFTRQTKVGKLMLANSHWCVWTAQKESTNTLANCWWQIERVCRLFLCRSHTPTWVCLHEFANFSLLCEGRLKCHNSVYTLWSRHSYQPMRVCIAAQLFYEIKIRPS